MAYPHVRASWHGTRIILRQTSPEAATIFDFIISLYNQCHGDWSLLGQKISATKNEIDAFLDYAACFLSNIGNYYASRSLMGEARGRTDRLLDRAPVTKSSFQGLHQRPWKNSLNSA